MLCLRLLVTFWNHTVVLLPRVHSPMWLQCAMPWPRMTLLWLDIPLHKGESNGWGDAFNSCVCSNMGVGCFHVRGGRARSQSVGQMSDGWIDMGATACGRPFGWTDGWTGGRRDSRADGWTLARRPDDRPDSRADGRAVRRSGGRSTWDHSNIKEGRRWLHHHHQYLWMTGRCSKRNSTSDAT